MSGCSSWFPSLLRLASSFSMMSPMKLGRQLGVIQPTLGSVHFSPSSAPLAYLITVATALDSPGHLSKRGRLDSPGRLAKPSGASVGSCFVTLTTFPSLKALLAAAHTFLQISVLSKKLALGGPHLPPVRISIAHVSSTKVHDLLLLCARSSLTLYSCDQSKLSRHHSIGSTQSGCTLTFPCFAILALTLLKVSTSVRYLPVLVAVSNPSSAWSRG